MADRKTAEPDPDPQDWPERFTAPLDSIGLVGKFDEATQTVVPFTKEELAEIRERSRISFAAKRRQQRNR